MQFSITKKQLKEYLLYLQTLAQYKVSKKLKYYSISQGYLEDLKSFLEILNRIPDTQDFHIITKTSRLYTNKADYTILFESDSIVLIEDDELYIYIIPKYKLK